MMWTIATGLCVYSTEAVDKVKCVADIWRTYQRKLTRVHTYVCFMPHRRAGNYKETVMWQLIVVHEEVQRECEELTPLCGTQNVCLLTASICGQSRFRGGLV